MTDQYGATPLHYAVQMCAQHQQQSTQPDENSCEMDTSRQDDIDRSMHLRVLQAVLSRTEIIDSFDQQLRTPLIWAATCGNLLCTNYADTKGMKWVSRNGSCILP